MPDSPEKILVRGLNWLGDAVMSTPALQRLREARPCARITLLSPEKLAGLWQDQPFVDRVLTFSPSENIWQVARRLRRGNIFRSCRPAQFPPVRARTLAGGNSPPPRVCAARPRIFLTQALPPRADARPMRKRSTAEIRRLIADNAPPAPIPPAAHHVHDYLYLTKELGGRPEPLPPRIFISGQQAADVCQSLRLESPTADRPWFGLNPGSGVRPGQTLAR